MRSGDTLGGQYVLEHVLGKGNMGVVWAAYDMQLEQQVAVKLILSGDDGPPPKELLQRLKREAIACEKLDHPNVVRVFNYGETEQQEPYIVFELLEGQPLAELLKQKRRLGPRQAAQIGADIASGLTAAHAAKVIHRDLKPANIFLHRTADMPEDEFITKVVDFGVCKDRDSIENVQTKTGMPIGSLAYMSPEQAAVRKDIDGRSDIFSLGLVIYEMLTGTRAFTAPPAELFQQIFKMTIPAPSSKVRDVPPELDAVVAKCTAKRPEHRYASAEELARELYAIAGMPMPVRQPSTSRPSFAAQLDVAGMFEAEIKASPAIPESKGARAFNPMARTIPLKKVQDSVEPPVVPDDPDDLVKTVQMNAQARPTKRPAVIDEQAVLRTQVMAPDAHIPSPEPEWKKAAAEWRETSRAFEVPPELLEAAGGATPMMAEADIRSTLPMRADATGTTSTAAVTTQPIVSAPPPAIVDRSTSTGSRKRGNKRMMFVAGGFLAASFVLMIVVVVGRGSSKTVEQSPLDPKLVPTDVPSAQAPVTTHEPATPAPQPSASAIVDSPASATSASSTPVPSGSATQTVPTTPAVASASSGVQRASPTQNIKRDPTPTPTPKATAKSPAKPAVKQCTPLEVLTGRCKKRP